MTPQLRRNMGYLLAVTTVPLTFVLRWWLGSTDNRPLLVFFIIPILFNAYVGGLWAGLLATTLAGVGTAIFRMPDDYFSRTSEVIQWVVLWASGFAVTLVVEGLRRAKGHAESVKVQLEIAAKDAREAQQELRLKSAALEAAANGIALTDSKGDILWANNAFAVMTGYTVDEVISQNTRILKSGQQDDAFYRGLWETITRGEVWRGELVNRRKDGAFYTEDMTITPVSDRRGGSYFIAIKQDVTARKQTQDALRDSEMRLRAIMDHANAIIWLKDLEGRFLMVNRYMEKTMQMPAAQIVGRSAYDFFPRNLASEYADHDRRVLETGAPMEFEESVKLPGGTHTYVAMKFPIRDSRGKIYALCAICTDITERARAEEALAEAKISAEQANRAKDHFLAVLSHELRTPLTPVLAAASALEMQVDLPKEVLNDMTMIRRNVELEARLIDDLLDVNRITCGKVQLERRPVDIGEIIHRAVEVCHVDIEARRLDFDYSCSCDMEGLIHGDATRLQQVFWNLLKNAIKFTPEGGRIRIICHRDGSHAITEISDSGIGIDPELIPRLFIPFEQGGTGTTRMFGGLGLGLTIAKGLIDVHGGTLTASSDGRGKGSTFQVRLPIATTRSVTPLQIKDSGALAPEFRRRLTVLLVEDHPDTSHIMRRLLATQGHDVHAAGDMASAIKTAGLHCFDLLLSDLGLPDGNGLDLLSNLRRLGHVMPAIALSGYGQEEDIRRSVEAGFAEHLTKPVIPSKLFRAIETVVTQTTQ